MRKNYVYVGLAMLFIVVCIVAVARIDSQKQTPEERRIEQVEQKQDSENNAPTTSPSGESVTSARNLINSVCLNELI